MSPEERQLLERTYRLTAENNEILRKMRRKEQWNSVFRWIYWIIIIVIAYVSFVAIGPYLEQLQGMTGTLQDQGSSYADLIKGLNSGN